MNATHTNDYFVSGVDIFVMEQKCRRLQSTACKLALDRASSERAWVTLRARAWSSLCSSCRQFFFSSCRRPRLIKPQELIAEAEEAELRRHPIISVLCSISLYLSPPLSLFPLQFLASSSSRLFRNATTHLRDERLVREFR